MLDLPLFENVDSGEASFFIFFCIVTQDKVSMSWFEANFRKLLELWRTSLQPHIENVKLGIVAFEINLMVHFQVAAELSLKHNWRRHLLSSVCADLKALAQMLFYYSS